jgi:hypothetical protein
MAARKDEHSRQQEAELKIFRDQDISQETVDAIGDAEVVEINNFRVCSDPRYITLPDGTYTGKEFKALLHSAYAELSWITIPDGQGIYDIHYEPVPHPNDGDLS